jgi:uncharacterized CHY-type Zn-finger protein
VQIRGEPVDGQTRCVHYSSDRDVVAIRFACCDGFYPCHRCHAETADHAAQVWPAERRDEHAVLCGVCGRTLTISAYLSAADRCPHCGAAFNPGCRAHRHLYFA